MPNPNRYEPVPLSGLEIRTNGIAASPTPAPAPEVVTNVAPPAVSPRSSSAAGAAKDYTVVRGDTLYKIARTHNVKVSALTNANRSVDFAKLKAGQKIHIPAPAAAAPGGLGFKEPGSSAADGGNIHVVKAGETLTHIAKLSHTTPKAIQAANGMKTTRLSVGQKLRLPVAGQPAATDSAKPAPAAKANAVAEM